METPVTTQYTPWKPCTSDAVSWDREGGRARLTGLQRTDPDRVCWIHARHLYDVGFRVVGDGLGQAKFIQLLDHDVLERRAANSDANGHSDGSHKGIHGSRPPRISDTADGLDADVDASEEHAHADSENSEHNGPDGGRCELVKEK